MMGSKISLRSALGPKISRASGTPMAKVFFTEQKKAAIRSAGRVWLLLTGPRRARRLQKRLVNEAKCS